LTVKVAMYGVGISPRKPNGGKYWCLWKTVHLKRKSFKKVIFSFSLHTLTMYCVLPHTVKMMGLWVCWFL